MAMNSATKHALLARTSKRARLEGEMMEQPLYCRMTWFECPGEVTGLLMTSVPHHKQTLEVRHWPDLC